MNQKEFIKHVKQECGKHNVKCILKNTQSIRLQDNTLCSGYFDGYTLAVSMNSPDFLSTLVHEYSHLTQWRDKLPLWNECDINKSHSKVEKWLAGENIYVIEKHLALCRDLELDNEKRSVKVIKQFNLEIDIDLYIKKANAYVQFYNYMLHSRKWCTPTNSPYLNQRLLDVMPNTFSMNYKTISKKVFKIFEEEGI